MKTTPQTGSLFHEKSQAKVAKQKIMVASMNQSVTTGTMTSIGLARSICGREHPPFPVEGLWLWLGRLIAVGRFKAVAPDNFKPPTATMTPKPATT
jgi:hypothetical protein